MGAVLLWDLVNPSPGADGLWSGESQAYRSITSSVTR